MNHVTLIGRLAADPEARTTQSGISQCSFRLAVPRRFTNQQGVREADFFNIVAWCGTADFCARYFRKGMRVGVEGSLQSRSYQAQDGTKRYVVEVIADNVEFCESRQDGGGANSWEYLYPLTSDNRATALSSEASDATHRDTSPTK